MSEPSTCAVPRMQRGTMTSAWYATDQYVVCDCAVLNQRVWYQEYNRMFYVDREQADKPGTATCKACVSVLCSLY